MKTSIPVINIPESIKISIKGPTYTYRITSEYINISATGPYQTGCLVPKEYRINLIC